MCHANIYVIRQITYHLKKEIEHCSQIAPKRTPLLLLSATARRSDKAANSTKNLARNIPHVRKLQIFQILTFLQNITRTLESINVA